MSLETSSQSQSFKLDNLLQSHLSHELQGTITGLVNSIMIRLDFDDKDKEAKSIKTAKDKVRGGHDHPLPDSNQISLPTGGVDQTSTR